MTTATLAAQQARVEESGYQPKLTVPVPRCPVCRETSRYTVAKRDRYGFDATFKLCNKCGLIYLTPRLSDEDYAEFYTSQYRPLLASWYGRPWDGEHLAKDQQAYNECVVEGLAKQLQGREGQTAIDIGGSAGSFATAIQDTYGLSCEVIDPNAKEIKLALDKGLTATLGGIDDVPAWRQFDVVFLMQTVEHLTRPLESFRKIRGHLRDGGIFIFDFVPLEQRKVSLEGLLKIDHPCAFTSYAARSLLEEAGLRLRCMYGLTGRHFHFVCEKPHR